MSVDTLKKWNNSPAVRLPAAVMEVVQLTFDQTVEVRARGWATPTELAEIKPRSKRC